MIASILRNAHRAKGAKASEPSDFFASLKEQPSSSAAAMPAKQSPEAMLAIFQIITGAKVVQ